MNLSSRTLMRSSIQIDGQFFIERQKYFLLRGILRCEVNTFWNDKKRKASFSFEGSNLGDSREKISIVKMNAKFNATQADVKTSLIEFRHQMPFGNLPVHLSLSCILNVID